MMPSLREGTLGKIQELGGKLSVTSCPYLYCPVRVRFCWAPGSVSVTVTTRPTRLILHLGTTSEKGARTGADSVIDVTA